MTSLSEKIMKTNFTIISKSEILETFKKSIAPSSVLKPLFDALNDVFVLERLEPENSKRHLPPKAAEVFVQVSPLQKTNKPVERVPRKKIFIQKSPFTNSGYADDPALRVWYYIDENDRIQGPFTSLEMDHWFDKCYFFNELLIRFKEQNDFVKLVDLFGKTEQPQNYRIVPQDRSDNLNQKQKLIDVNIWEKIKPVGGNKDEIEKESDKPKDQVDLEKKSETKASATNPSKEQPQNIKEEKKQENLKQGLKQTESLVEKPKVEVQPNPQNIKTISKDTSHDINTKSVKPSGNEKLSVKNEKNLENTISNEIPKKVEKIEENKNNEKNNKQLLEEIQHGPTPVDSTKETVEQGDWIATKKLKNKKNQPKKSNSNIDNQQTLQYEEKILEANEPIKSNIDITTQPISTQVKIEQIKTDETIESNPNIKHLNSQSLTSAVQNQEVDKKPKTQQKKKIIGSWNTESDVQTLKPIQQRPPESLASEFPSLNDVQEKVKSENKEPSKSSKGETEKTVTSTKQNTSKSNPIIEDFPVLGQDAPKQIKNPIKQEIPQKPEKKKIEGGKWGQPNSTDGNKKTGDSKYSEDFPSL